MHDKDMKIIDLAEEVLNVSRNSLLISLRFMDKPISMLPYICDSLVPDFSVDGKKILYNPIHVLKSFANNQNLISRQQLHMIFHCLFLHFFMPYTYNPKYWDLACDIVSENTIIELGLNSLTLPHEAEQEAEISKLKPCVKYFTADHLYNYFVSTNLSYDEADRIGALFRADTHTAWYSLQEEHNDDSPSDAEQSNPSQCDGDDDNNSDTPSNNSGGNSDDNLNSNEDTPFSNMQALSEEWKNVAEQMKMDLETFSKKQGTEAGCLIQNLSAVTREKYDYRSFLKRFATLGERMKINDDEFDYIFYTYGLSLYEKMPLIEPLEYKDIHGIRELAIAIDTSGSTRGSLVQSFLQKTYNILKGEENFFTRFNLHIIQCDADIQADTKITNQEEFDRYIKDYKIRGGGGTDFTPVFRYVDELIKNNEFINLKGLIYFTDGCGTFPSRQPSYNTAFVFIDDDYNNYNVPVWAIKLILQSEDIGRI